MPRRRKGDGSIRSDHRFARARIAHRRPGLDLPEDVRLGLSGVFDSSNKYAYTYYIEANDTHSSETNRAMTMPRITLYVSDDEKPTWDRAKALSDGSLSGFVTNAVRDAVAQQERHDAASAAGAMDRVELEVSGPKRVRFTGRLLAELRDSGCEQRIYLKKDGQIVLWSESIDGASFKPFDSLDALREDNELWLDHPTAGPLVQMLEEAYEEMGEDFVIDLD